VDTDLLVCHIDAKTCDRMKRIARRQGKSPAQTTREAITEKFAPGKDEVWAEIDRFRNSLKPARGSSVGLIRKVRERDVSGH
jgi:hypothetical protein